MPADYLHRVSKGQKVANSARFHNATCEAIEAFKRSGAGGGNGLEYAERSPTKIRVRNDTGGDRDAFEVVQLTEPLITPDDNETEWKYNPTMIAEAVEAGTEKYALLLNAIPEGDLGWALVAGCSPARVHFTSATVGDWEWASAGDDAACFEGDLPGSVEVLWREGIAGEQWAFVRLKGVTPILVGKADYDITKGDSGAISIYGGTVADSLADLGWNVEAYARLGDITATAWVYVYKFPWGYEVINAECV